jgi:hypothetical protein
MEVNRFDGQGRPVLDGLVIDNDLVVGGDITGNVTGDVTGDITGDVTGDVDGNATLTKLIFDTGNEVTISSGVITVTGSLHWVDTENDDATDDLVTINGGTGGQLLLLRPESDARTVVLKDNTGNLRLAGDFSLDGAKDNIFLWYDGNQWAEISRSDNG